jgi:hypothetical protein
VLFLAFAGSGKAALVSTEPVAILERMSIAESNHQTTRLGGITGKGFKPGQSGNPGGRPKGLAAAVREICGGSPLRLARGLLEIAENPKTRDRDRVAATGSYLTVGGARHRRSRRSRAVIHLSWVRSPARSRRSRTN